MVKVSPVVKLPVAPVFDSTAETAVIEPFGAISEPVAEAPLELPLMVTVSLSL